MKQPLHHISGWHGWIWFCGIGWLLAGLLSFWAAPRIYHRLINHFPIAQKEAWDQTISRKKRELSSRWADPRPLIILAGDSHVEMGNWYDLFAGAWAVRNCGLSRAKITDVTQLVASIGDAHPQMVVLMCGVNSLGTAESRDDCVRDYEELLTTTQSHLRPASILVLSVMPVRESGVDHASHEFNAGIRQFNDRLAAACKQHQVDFLDVNSAVSDTNGALLDDLTIDGLHLNQDGYRRLAGFIALHLPKPATNP